MKQENNNLANLIYLKNKLQKWKNISFLILVLSLILIARFLFGDFSQQTIDVNGYIANIKIEGIILEDEFRDEILEKVIKQDNVKAVLIRINSPGGGIVGSEILYNKIRNIAQKKPTVILLESVAASGGYMAAIGGDYIVAHNGTLTGSIGVLMQSAQVTELAKKIGVEFKSYKSSPIKGSPSPFEADNPQVDKLINESIADSYKFFSDLVYERRKSKITEENFKIVTDGRVVTGRQALEFGLIDEIGDKSAALNYLKNKFKIDVDNLPLREVKIFEENNNIFDRFFSFLPFYQEQQLLNKGQIMAVMP